MDHSDFRIGLEFWCKGRQWRCTDVGSRVVIAIRVDSADVVTWLGGGSQSRRTLTRDEAEEIGWFAGPPYRVDEYLFDEEDIERCSLEPGSS